MAEFIKTLWSDKIIQALYEDPDLNAMFDRSLESYARSQGGNKIILPTLSANSSIQRTDNKTIGSGLPLTTVDIAKNGIELFIYEYTYGPILIRKLDDVQSNSSLLQKNITEITQAFKEFILTAAAEHAINNTNASHKIPWTGASGAEFVFADLKKMRTLLNKAKVLNINRYCTMDAEAEDHLGKDDYLKNWFAVQQSAIQEGTMPKLAGFNINPTVLVPKSKADGTIDANPALNTKLNVVGWKKEHFNLVVQTEMEITGSEQAKLLGFEASFTNRFGVLLERDKAAVVATQQ